MMAKRLMLLLGAVALVGCGGVEELEPAADVHTAAAGLLGAPAPLSAAAFWMAVYETEIPRNPIADHSRCTFGDEGTLLVAGAALDLDRHLPPPLPFVRRTCRVMPGRQLVLPVVTASMDGASLPVKPDERLLARRVAGVVGSARHLRVELDGRDVRSLGAELVRTGPQTYGYVLPEAGAVYPSTASPFVAPAVADGILAKLPALTPGRHQLVVKGKVAGRPFRAEYVIDAR